MPWRRRPPPLEAYSRVTNPERFQVLHDRAAEILSRLEAEYDVIREDHTPVTLPSVVSLARPAVGLVPRQASAAPLRFAFTAFPGIFLYFGNAARAEFPPCGCDACGYTGEGQVRELTELVEDVVAGRFEEYVLDGGRIGWRVWGDGHERAQGVFPGADAKPIRWRPWPRGVNRVAVCESSRGRRLDGGFRNG